jgi:hypothetical protein
MPAMKRWQGDAGKEALARVRWQRNAGKGAAS